MAQMRWRLDLSDYDQVKNNAALIYGQIESKSMPPPPFSPFSDEFIAKFKSWMDQNCPA